jgi:hypothetical protein
VSEVVLALVDHQRGALAVEQILRAEGIGGGDQFSRTVRPDRQRGEITAGRVACVARGLEMTARGEEIAPVTTAGRLRVRLAFPD